MPIQTGTRRQGHSSKERFVFDRCLSNQESSGLERGRQGRLDNHCTVVGRKRRPNPSRAISTVEKSPGSTLWGKYDISLEKKIRISAVV